MIVLDQAGYQNLAAAAAVVEADAFGPKVLLRPDGSYLKLFRRKRLLSSALWRPYAQRFADHATLLGVRGIPCPAVIAVYRQREIARDIVHYRPLAGRTIRQLIRAGMPEAEAASLRRRLKAFVDRLHQDGIYFRSVHLGNIVLTPENDLGLIDIADLKHQAGPLGARQRQRNFAHILRYAADRDWLLLSPDWAGLVR